VFVLALSSQVLGQGLLVYALGSLSPLVVGLTLLTQPAISALVGWLVYGETLGALD
jgi:drug/metabolite transporter (DMT)-like permease